MAMRRPRIKPVANILLNSKRKPKSASDVKPLNIGESDVNDAEDNRKTTDVQRKENSSDVEKLLEVRTEPLYDEIVATKILNKSDDDHKNIEVTEERSIETSCENAPKNEYSNKNTNQLSLKNDHSEQKESINDSDAFKCPPKVGMQRVISHTSNSGIDDVFYSDIEENALQMDLENASSNCSISPSKNMVRPRIRPTPHFGQRRNSFVGSSTSPHTSAMDDNHLPNSNVSNDLVQLSLTRRERHHSASNIGSNHSLHHHTPHKYLPAGITNSIMGRIRTESGCSVFSDTNTSPHKQRKIDDNKQNARKEYEARFEYGVPERSVIKMSDLIFYNPFTNPMERKPIPNVKLEQKETSSNDVKPFAAKLEIGTDKLTDNEAVPVPQLKLNAKGELILDDKSLVIETTAEQEARKVLANSSLIYLDEYTGMNGFYSRKKRVRDWIPSDTIKFYRCLQNIGTDFSLMVTLFPNRTRRELKLKFKCEEKRNNHLINKALLYPKQFDIESLKQQMDEEDKLRIEQIKDTKKKIKKEKKKINCQSKATRILINDVYQNEINHKENRISKTTREKNKPEDIPQTEKKSKIPNDPVEIEKNEDVTQKESENKIKTKTSKKTAEKLSEVEKLIEKEYDNANHRKSRYYAMKQRQKKLANNWKKRKTSTSTKREIKIENKREPNEIEFQDTKQLELEMDDLLNMDAVDFQYDDSYETSTSNEFCNTSKVEKCDEQFNTSSQVLSKTNDEKLLKCIIENDAKIEKYEHRTFVNINDGSLNVYSNIKDDIVFITSPSMSAQLSTSLSPTDNEYDSFESITNEPEIVNNETCSSISSERELNEADIQSILTELAEGSLVLVSSLDPDDPDKVLNEIYMVDKNTGDLCEEPLSIPDNIVQCILAVVS